jgi:type I restriction enzyme S subunit
MLDAQKNRGIMRPYLANVNVRWGEFKLDDLREMRFESDEIDRFGLKYGDIVMCEGGEPGRSAIWKEQVPGMMLQKALHRIRAHNCLEYRFLYYSLMQTTAAGHLACLFTGATIKHLPLEKLAKVEVHFPSRAVQVQIADILSAYDDLIENNTRRVRILEEMAQMIYREWFVNFRFPGHDGAKFADSELGPIPAGWTGAPLESVCARITDGSHWSPTSVPSPYRMASSKDMHRWGLDLSTARTIAKEDFESLIRNDCKPLAGDILITKDGANYLKYCFVVEKDIDAVILSSIAMVRPDRRRASPHYLAFHLGDPSVKSRLAGLVSGAAIPRIVLKDFRQFRILLPPTKIQEGFERIVGPMVGLCWRLIDQNANLRATRDFLLPKLISGAIPVEAADDVAGEFLEQTA